jgi:catechol 2,3-dioxygenase-like lactoylglutathione lyase family enzyme
MGKQVATSAPNRPAFELAFTTDDVPSSLHAALSAGAVLVQEAAVMPWGQTLSYVRAPEGTLIEICTPTP